MQHAAVARPPIRVPTLHGAEKLRTAGKWPSEPGRDHGTPCQHENACVRCPLLWVDPAQLARLEEFHANLVGRLQEAKDEGWLGEVAAIETTMAAAAQKLEAMRAARSATVHLGMPDIRAAIGRSSQG